MTRDDIIRIAKEVGLPTWLIRNKEHTWITEELKKEIPLDWHLSWEAIPLYVKKEWVGLTDKDIEDCLEMSIQGTCRAIEAKLKEKNT